MIKKNKNKKIITLFSFYLILGSILFLMVTLNTQSVFAISITDSLENAANTAGLKGETDIQKIVSRIIDVVLGLLGLIFLILILVGGFQWMTSAGEPEKIKKARGLLTNAVIGLLIISAFYAITQFVFSLIGVETV